MTAFVAHPAAVVSGPAAVGVAWLLRRAVDQGDIAGVPSSIRDATVAAVQAVEMAAAAWAGRTAAEFGRTAAPPAPPPSSSSHGSCSSLTVPEAAAVLQLSHRRVRDLAASGLGRKAGGAWVLDPMAVQAEARRRAAS